MYKRQTYNNGYFTKAICKSIDKIEYKADKCVSTILNFSRQAFWYSDEGQKAIMYNLPASSTAEINIYNPEKFDSVPYIKLSYNQDVSLEINNTLMQIKAVFAKDESIIELDSELHSAFSGLSDMNNYLQCNYFPKFKPGWNTIKLLSQKSNAFNTIEIIPRWRRL